MNTSRRGKIAQLPRAIRHQLNLRLQDGEEGKSLVAWLNSLPEAQAIVAAGFGGKPIREQNLSEWKHGGYRDWLLQQQALEVAVHLWENAGELADEDRPPLSDSLALCVTARYAVACREISATEGPEGWRLLRELCADLVKIRRGDHSAGRLELERDRLEQKREKTEEEMFEWAMQPENRQRIVAGVISPEETAARMGEILKKEMTYTPGRGFHPVPKPTAAAQPASGREKRSAAKEPVAGGVST